MHKICERTDTKIVTAYKHLHTNLKKNSSPKENSGQPVTSWRSVSVENRIDERGEISNWFGLAV